LLLSSSEALLDFGEIKTKVHHHHQLPDQAIAKVQKMTSATCTAHLTSAAGHSPHPIK
jgi:hypothetical protein